MGEAALRRLLIEHREEPVQKSGQLLHGLLPCLLRLAEHRGHDAPSDVHLRSSVAVVEARC